MEKSEFIIFLKSAKSKISSVRFIPKGNSAYQALSDIEREVRYQCVTFFKLSWEEFEKCSITRNLQNSSKILKEYPFKGSEKRKAESIEEFKKEYVYDLDHLIFHLEYQPKESTEAKD